MRPQDQPQVVVSVPHPTVITTRAITVTGADGKTQTLTIPGNEGDMQALMARRQELSDQLTSVSDRRHDLSMELQGTVDEGARAGLQGRIAVLDKRILQLENDIGVTGSQLAAAPANLIGITESARNEPQGDQFPEGVVIGGFSGLAFASIVYALTRRVGRRSSRSAPALQDTESAQRLARLEQGMDAIAVEIERISEGQRFVTKLLSDTPVAAPLRIATAKGSGAEER